jgi:poly(3-hydroxybutyrate) depolymerase
MFLLSQPGLPVSRASPVLGSLTLTCGRFVGVSELVRGSRDRTIKDVEDAYVKFCRLEGGTHSWYTGPMDVSGQIPYNPDFNSTTGVTEIDVLWNFLVSHPKR